MIPCRSRTAAATSGAPRMRGDDPAAATPSAMLPTGLSSGAELPDAPVDTVGGFSAALKRYGCFSARALTSTP